MKRYTFHQTIARSYKSGPREGQMRVLELPDEAILLDAKPGYEYDSRTKDDWPIVRVTYALPVQEES